MVRTPHLYLPGPWSSTTLELNPGARHHLSTVLRRTSGDAVTYTDGTGTLGHGVFDSDGIRRGGEGPGAPRSGIHIVVAPPHRTERTRTLIEKLVELGVESISWLASQRSQSSGPRSEKSQRWAVAALEQSGGTWLPDIGATVAWDGLQARSEVWVADPAAAHQLPASLDAPVTLVIGPEGGFAPAEVPPAVQRFVLTNTTLRTETAAIAAAMLAVDRLTLA